MASGIGEESVRMSSINSDVDLFRYKYLDYEKQIDGSNVDISFVSPIFSVYERYRFYLLANSERIELPDNWKYRPDYVSFDKYGTTAWWQLILWINGVKSIEYFTQDTIIVPTRDAVAELENEGYGTSDGYIDINEDYKHKKTLYTLYKQITDNISNIETSSGTAAALTDDDTKSETEFCREIFTMTIPILRLKYVDLEHEPIEDSVRVIANCRPNLIYNKHYKLVEDDNGSMRRITWDPDIVNNAGLLFKLTENDSVEVQYVRYI